MFLPPLVGQIIASVNGTDLAGNTLSSTASNSINFLADSVGPSVTLSHNETDNVISRYEKIKLTKFYHHC